MNAQELFLKNGKSANVFYCSVCRLFSRTKEYADSCCLCMRCKVNSHVLHSCYCEECRKIIKEENNIIQAEAARAKMEKAEDVDVFEYIWYNEKMYSDLESIIDDCEYAGCPVPEYVHLMKSVMFPGLNLNDLIERFDEEYMIEDVNVMDNLQDMDLLKIAFAEFNQCNEHKIIYWVEDITKKVKIG